MVGSVASWRPRTPFYYGWLVLGAAAVGAFAATGIAQLVLGAIQGLIFEDTGWDRGTIAYGVTAGTWTSGLLTPLVGRLADRYGPRPLMPLAALVVGICFFALAGVQAVWHFYLAYIVGRAIANPNLIGVVPRTVAVNFFRRRRNLTLGLTSMARPVGGAVNIQLISAVAHVYSWRVAYRFLGVFAFILVVPLWLVMRRRPEDIGLRPDGDPPPARTRAPSIPGVGGRAVDGEPGWRPGWAVRTGTFWLIVAADSLGILIAGAVSFQAVLYLRDSGLSQPAAALAMSLSALLGALVNPAWGYLSDRHSARGLAILALLATSAVTSLFLVTDSGVVGFVVLILWGTASGGLNILGNMMLAQYFGRRSFGSISGLMGPFQLGFLGLGPTFGAVLFDLTDSYTGLFAFGVASYACAALLLYRVRTPALPGETARLASERDEVT